MFGGCTNLEYINLQNFDESQLVEYDEMFEYVPNNIVICININCEKIRSKLKDQSCYNIDCTNNWKLGQNKLKNGICIKN